MAQKSVALLFAPGFEEIEALTVSDILYRAKIDCDRISVPNTDFVESSHGVRVSMTAHLEDVDLSDYEMVVLPGGLPGTTNLEETPSITKELARRAENGLPFAAICAAPSIPAKLGLLEGRDATSNPGYHAVLTEHGAQLHSDAEVVKSGAIITSQGMGTAIPFALEIVRFLSDEATVEKVKQSIVYFH